MISLQAARRLALELEHQRRVQILLQKADTTIELIKAVKKQG
jgi:hypothetical protein